MSMSARIEIVHLSDDTLFDYSTRCTDSLKEKIQRIISLKNRYPKRVFSISGPADEIDPSISRNTRIILGGAVKNKCVDHRYQTLKAAGFNVAIYNCITLSKADLHPLST